MKSRSALPMVLLLLLPAAATAHEYWLSPSSYRAAAGDTVAIEAYVGTGFRGERKPYAEARAVRFTLHGAKQSDLRRVAVNGGPGFARFTLPDGGGALVAYESSFVPIELRAEEFDRYLRLEGLDGPLAERRRLGAGAGPGRERYARCAKTWVAGRDVGRVRRPAGLPFELVPLDDPAADRPLRVRVLYRSRPLAGALVRAWRQPLGPGDGPRAAAARDSVGAAAEARSGADGIATLAIAGPGEWLIGAVHMVRSGDRIQADWESLWASLTFARPERR